MAKTLIFVYNADTGLFNTVADIAHKIFSPETYPCSLCAITHTSLGMKEEWKKFIEELKMPVVFLHRDEFLEAELPKQLLPVILIKDHQTVSVLADATAIDACKNVGDLKRLIRSYIS
jgi:hypothetical protein